MRALEAGQSACALAGFGVDNLYARPVRNVHDVRCGIGQQIIPSSVAANLPVIHDLKFSGRGFGSDSFRGQDGQEHRSH